MGKSGWNSQIMASFYGKEPTYNAGVTMSGSTACSLKGFSNGPAEWKDTVINDKEEVTGKEFGYDQELVEKGLEMTLSFPKAKPNDLIGLAALTLGSVTSTQDAALTAYKHKMVPIAAGTPLPSIQVEEKWGGVQQYAYKGVKSNTLKISGKGGGLVSVESGVIGSGTRSESATAFVPSIIESWLKVNQMLAWLENGAAISISPALTQGGQNIGAAPRDIKAVLDTFEVIYNNNQEPIVGFGGAGVLNDLEYKRRTVDLKFTMLFQNKTDLDYYLNQTAYAFEVDLKGALIAAGGTMYYGGQIIIPRFKLKTAPIPKGGPGDMLRADFDCEVFEDGTNPPIIIEGYNAKASYLV